MEKQKIIFSPCFVSMEMAAIFDFRALTKVHNFKTASSNAVKSCTHIEDTQMKKRTEAFSLLLRNTIKLAGHPLRGWPARLRGHKGSGLWKVWTVPSPPLPSLPSPPLPCPALPLPSLPPSLPPSRVRYSECAHILTWPHSE